MGGPRSDRPSHCASPELAKLVASDAWYGDLFGISVALDGDTTVIGASSDSHVGAEDAGSAYVFVRDGGTWVLQQKLIPLDIVANDFFGVSVALSGDTVLVGSPNDSHAGGSVAGSAYVFTRSGSTWTQQAKLTASDAATGQSFGVAVALVADTAVVGAYGDDHAGLFSGSAYVFTRSGTVWTQQQKLTASDAANYDRFAEAVALSGETALIGATGSGGTNAGAAYVFVRSSGVWTQQQKLTSSDLEDNDYFGDSVSLDGDTAVMGATGDSHAGGTSAGSAYVFTRSGTTWAEQAKLTAFDAMSWDLCGYSVAVAGDTALVGAWGGDNAPVYGCGAAYVFTRAGAVWTQLKKLAASDAANDDVFGVAVAISADTALIGAYSDDHSSVNDAGSAYFFTEVAQVGPPCPANIVCDVSVNVPDLLAVINFWGPCAGCPADVNDDGQVNVPDLLAVINTWGPCP